MACLLLTPGGLSLADTWWPDLEVTMEVGNLLHDYIAGAIGGE